MAIPDPIDTALERRFRGAQFLMSTPDHHKLPADEGREVAFAGRSNAGKSSAINVICDQGGLARTSKTPGRTQQLVVFGLTENERLIDLPGYGYAKVPLAIKRDWHTLIDAYVRERQALAGIVIVSDFICRLIIFNGIGKIALIKITVAHITENFSRCFIGHNTAIF